MAMSFPYTRYTCPCDSTSGIDSAVTRLDRASLPSKRPSRQAASTSPQKRPLPTQSADSDNEDDPPFDTHDLRANYALHPISELLFCDECNQIRCPKCWHEETMNWYCPQCLFEVPSSVVRGDGNRCSRNCYQCPACTSVLTVVAHERTQQTDGASELLRPPGSESTGATGDTYVLQCGYCDWSSHEVDVTFSRPTKITEQLSKQRKARLAPPKRSEDDEQEGEKSDIPPSHDHDTLFNSLSKFYRDQLEEVNDGSNLYGSSPYAGSPANLARIMSLYGGLSHTALKKSREKPQPMREAQDGEEGVVPLSADTDALEEDMLEKMQSLGWDGTASNEQRCSAPTNFDSRFIDKLWPMATPLRTRRGKRCKVCRQFLSRPEPKVSSFRYKIRLLAQNHIPRLGIKPLNSTTAPQNPSFRLKMEALDEEPRLQPHMPHHYILTVRNPIFETVKVSLATPATTPGKVASRVTILCPTFTVGPAGDVWDDALSTSAGPQQQQGGDGSRRAAMASLTGSADGGDRQPEAGKIWEKTRNTTSVVLEIVPGALKAAQPIVLGETAQDGHQSEPKWDEGVLEVPVFVRAEWEADVHGDATGASVGAGVAVKGEKEHRELAYWCVLGVGRLAG